MSYNYQTQRPFVFTEEGQRMFLKIRDYTKELLDEAGTAMLQNMISDCTGDTWNMLACVDRLVELKEILELPNPYSTAGQHRVFIAPFRN